MIRKLLFFSLLIFTATVQLKAQGLADCRKIIVQDHHRRSFDARNSFSIDVDGDGKPDTITSRTYRVKVNRMTSSKTKPKVRENYWIAFDINTSKGRVLNSFFKYNYGTNEAVYWVYALVPCKINRDGKTELLFYSGDDTTQETVILENTRNIFKVYSRKVEELSSL